MLNFKIDWLEFTYWKDTSVDNKNRAQFTTHKVCDLGMTSEEERYDLFEMFIDDFPEFENLMDDEKFIMISHGMHGYTHCFQYADEFMIWYHPEKHKMGIHVIFPAHGIYKLAEIFQLECIDSFAKAKDLFTILKSRSCKITRVDLAYDDYEKVLTPHDYNRLMSTGRIKTPARCFTFVSSGQRKGGTFYLGRRGSDRLLRIYDKEYESNGSIDAIRYEFELRKRYAEGIVKLILDDHKFSFAEIIKDYMQVVQEYSLNTEGVQDSALWSRKSRSEIDVDWQYLLQLFDKVVFNSEEVNIVIPEEKGEISVRKWFDWYIKYVCPSLFVMEKALGKDLLLDAIYSQESRAKPEKLNIALKYKDEKEQLQKYWEESLKRDALREEIEKAKRSSDL